MFTEIVKLIPKVDGAELNSMFNSLNKRFTNVASKFGQGMKNAFKFGGIAALATGILSKLLNPLQHAEEVIDRLLHKGDSAVTNANELGTTPGKLLRLESLGQAKSIDPEEMRVLLSKFQIALAREQEAASAPARIQKQIDKESDPDKKAILKEELKAAVAEQQKGGLLHNFIGIKDTADAFFAFAQSVSKLPTSQKTVVQSQVFGEKLRGKTSQFFNTTDEEFASILKRFHSESDLTSAANKANDLSGKRDLLSSIREQDAFFNQTGGLKDTQITDIEKSKQIQDTKDAEDLKRFDQLKVTAIAMDQLGVKLEKFVTELGVEVLPKLVTALDLITKSLPSVGDTVKGITSVTDPILQSTANFVENTSQVIDDPGQALRNDIERLQGFLEGTWAEFKSSRIYRTFGGN